MLRRARTFAVLGFLIAGGIGIISSTQTWVTAQRTDSDQPLLVTGADALPLLAPLSLAVLALGGAMSIAGTALRYVFAALGLAGALTLIAGTAPVALNPQLSAVSSAFTDATGLRGADVLEGMIDSLDPSGWGVTALCAWAALLLSSGYALATAHRWRSRTRRYDQHHEGVRQAGGPLDPVDSWDELSNGTDPTGASR